MISNVLMFPIQIVFGWSFGILMINTPKWLLKHPWLCFISKITIVVIIYMFLIYLSCKLINKTNLRKWIKVIILILSIIIISIGPITALFIVITSKGEL